MGMLSTLDHRLGFCTVATAVSMIGQIVQLLSIYPWVCTKTLTHHNSCLLGAGYCQFPIQAAFLPFVFFGYHFTASVIGIGKNSHHIALGNCFPNVKGNLFQTNPMNCKIFPSIKSWFLNQNLPTKLRPCKTQAPSTKKIRVQCIGILIMHWPLQRKKILPNCIHILSHHSLIWPATSTVSFMPFHQESFSLSKCRYSMGPPKTMPVPWAKTHKVKPHLMIVSASATGAIHVS